MKQTYRLGLSEHRLVRFSGSNTPSEASSAEAKKEKGNEVHESDLPHAPTIVYDGWDGFRNSSIDRDKNSSASVVSRLLKGGNLGVIVPDGTEIFPHAGFDEKGEMPLGNGMILSYERGVIDADGTTVDVSVKYAEVPLPGDVVRGTFENGPVKRLEAEMGMLRPQIDRTLARHDRAVRWHDGLATFVKDMRALMEDGRGDVVVKRLQDYRGQIWERSRDKRQRDTLEDQESDKDPYELQYAVDDLVDATGSPNTKEIEFLLEAMDADAKSIERESGRRLTQAVLRFRRYEALRATMRRLSSNAAVDLDEREWHDRVRKSLGSKK